MTVIGPMTRSDRLGPWKRSRHSFNRVETAWVRGLPASMFWWLGDRDRDGLSRYRRCRPCAQQLDQKLLLFLGFGLRDPAHGLFGILPELIETLTLPPSVTTPL